MLLTAAFAAELRAAGGTSTCRRHAQASLHARTRRRSNHREAPWRRARFDVRASSRPLTAASRQPFTWIRRQKWELLQCSACTWSVGGLRALVLMQDTGSAELCSVWPATRQHMVVGIAHPPLASRMVAFCQRQHPTQHNIACVLAAYRSFKPHHSHQTNSSWATELQLLDGPWQLSYLRAIEESSCSWL